MAQSVNRKRRLKAICFTTVNINLSNYFSVLQRHFQKTVWTKCLSTITVFSIFVTVQKIYKLRTSSTAGSQSPLRERVTVNNPKDCFFPFLKFIYAKCYRKFTSLISLKRQSDVHQKKESQQNVLFDDLLSWQHWHWICLFLYKS